MKFYRGGRPSERSFTQADITERILHREAYQAGGLSFFLPARGVIAGEVRVFSKYGRVDMGFSFGRGEYSLHRGDIFRTVVCGARLLASLMF
ncbi:hypothetical protein [Erwinia pyrifoliae]|uniref:hypothetical protein n=1 Tax=Erwinia pyrifoliae TaxID=79967 RepID=UPI0001C132AA|nr:hypothetical protein [Erwinia pyrifoliae]AUX73846.1 hypothetical protein CPI84_16095 [Erwinia pyrifoliae]MCA8875824.1 hypothetical protein [Erwinia pyrifoliae]UWS28823.1 hypothetical protein NYP81_12880 [Erwinia pyrifoliae]UXK11814.1 hypothetical protein NYP80_16195 [Erwinia pyrifoliae]CAY72938.1 hypothetical protein EPYR_00582 [Erwinia pyrifoliae DSM 12163]